MEYKKFDEEELADLLEMRGMINSARAVRAKLAEDKQIDVNDIIDNNPISEYEGLSDRMKAKIQQIIASLKEDKENQVKAEADDREEKDTLDEKEGKEELDENKKKEVEKQKREQGEEPKDENQQESDEQEQEENADKKQQEGKEETPKKDEYLAKVKRLHEMKIRDYKDQMRKDDPKIDKYFITMMYLQKSINRQRAAFIKEYGAEELTKLENQYLKEQLKYEKTLNIRMERDLSKLRQLDAKLDSILDRMETLQKDLEDGNISLEEYNEEINGLEKDKLDTLWQINRLNPELLEEKQENLKTREWYERKAATAGQLKERKKDITPENKAKTSAIEYSEKKQEGVAEKVHKDMEKRDDKYLDNKEKRLDALKKELRGIDITTLDGKKKALLVIGEIQTLEAQKMSHEKQIDNLEKNMGTGVESYSDLEKSEEQREEVIEEYEQTTEKINPENVSDDLISQLKNQAMDDPSNTQQAQEYLDDMNKIAEEAKKEQEKDDKEKEEGTEEKVRTYGKNGTNKWA